MSLNGQRSPGPNCAVVQIDLSFRFVSDGCADGSRHSLCQPSVSHVMLSGCDDGNLCRFFDVPRGIMFKIL